MVEQLTSQLAKKDFQSCFFSKQITYLESRDFLKNEEHLKSCLECQNKISDFENYRLNLREYFESFKASSEVHRALSRELADIIPNIKEDKISSIPTLKQTKYSLSIKQFLIFLFFGISRKTQIALCALLILVAFIY